MEKNKECRCNIPRLCAYFYTKIVVRFWRMRSVGQKPQEAAGRGLPEGYPSEAKGTSEEGRGEAGPTKLITNVAAGRARPPDAASAARHGFARGTRHNLMLSAAADANKIRQA